MSAALAVSGVSGAPLAGLRQRVPRQLRITLGDPRKCPSSINPRSAFSIVEFHQPRRGPHKLVVQTRDIVGALGGAVEIMKGKAKVNAACASSDGKHATATSEVRTRLGLKVSWAGFVDSVHDSNVVGRVALGRRKSSGWCAQEN